MGTVYDGKSTKCIYNGVPEWNYEEEMISTNNAIWWSPDSKFFAFLAFDISKIDLLQYSVFPEFQKSSSPDEVDSSDANVEQYNQVIFFLL